MPHIYPYGVSEKDAREKKTVLCDPQKINAHIFKQNTTKRNKLKKEANDNDVKIKTRIYRARVRGSDAIWRVATFFLVNYVTEGRLSHASTFLISHKYFSFVVVAVTVVVSISYSIRFSLALVHLLSTDLLCVSMICSVSRSFSRLPPHSLFSILFRVLNMPFIFGVEFAAD